MTAFGVVRIQYVLGQFPQIHNGTVGIGQAHSYA